MPNRLAAALLFCVLLLTAAKKPTVVSTHGENEDLILSATLYLDPADIKELIGNDLGGHYIVIDVKVEPKYGKEVTVDLDDFVLRTNKDGERSRPYVASQVAGSNAIVVKQADNGNGKSRTGISLGGIGVGSGGDVIPPRNATVRVTNDEADNPLEKTLDGKILPQKKTEQPVSGLLYFPMEKQKMKDLELLYGDKANRITLRFR